MGKHTRQRRDEHLLLRHADQSLKDGRGLRREVRGVFTDKHGHVGGVLLLRDGADDQQPEVGRRRHRHRVDADRPILATDHLQLSVIVDVVFALKPVWS